MFNFIKKIFKPKPQYVEVVQTGSIDTIDPLDAAALNLVKEMRHTVELMTLDEQQAHHDKLMEIESCKVINSTPEKQKAAGEAFYAKCANRKHPISKKR